MNVPEFLSGAAEISVDGPGVFLSFEVFGVRINITETVIVSSCIVIALTLLVLFLTHDYSIFRALKAIGKEEEGERITKPIRVGDNVFIGARATLLPGVSIGENTIIGAGTVVAGDIPAGVVAAGNPARVIRPIEEHAKAWLNEKNHQ